PEAKAKMISLGNIEEKISVTREMLNEIKEKLNTGKEEEVNLVTFGCPHASLDEIKEIAGLLAGKKVRQGIELWVCTSRAMKDRASELGLVKKIESAGGHVVADTCMVVSPIYEMGYRKTATNSAKSAKYLRDLCKQKVFFGELEDMVCE
ncbi:MAG: aconitase X, partial [Candidatus Micrarchaeia archaeon]